MFVKTFFRAIRALSALLLAASALPALAAIPLAERDVLTSLYDQTNGDSWTDNTNWKTAGSFSAAGTECTWFGVVCDGTETHVIRINLDSNNLVGTLPSTLNSLTDLTIFYARWNQLSGSIPSLTGLSALEQFYVGGNQLTGSIPSLTGLSALWWFSVIDNQLTGPIPSLAGLTNLRIFAAYDNQLTGNIPSLDGLSSLQSFYVQDNRLTGAPPVAPASLLPSASQLCPNRLTPSPTTSINDAWDTATGEAPWSQNCVAPLNSSTTTAVPALDDLSLALLGLLLAGGAAVRMRRKG